MSLQALLVNNRRVRDAISLDAFDEAAKQWPSGLGASALSACWERPDRIQRLLDQGHRLTPEDMSLFLNWLRLTPVSFQAYAASLASWEKMKPIVLAEPLLREELLRTWGRGSRDSSVRLWEELGLSEVVQAQGSLLLTVKTKQVEALREEPPLVWKLTLLQWAWLELNLEACLMVCRAFPEQGHGNSASSWPAWTLENALDAEPTWFHGLKGDDQSAARALLHCMEGEEISSDEAWGELKSWWKQHQLENTLPCVELAMSQPARL